MRRSTKHAHGHLELMAQDLDNALDPVGTGHRKAVDVRSPDEHGGRSERERLRDVGATADSTVHEDRNPSTHCRSPQCRPR
jgi:hypothetical protein